jgi:hypothetical protein
MHGMINRGLQSFVHDYYGARKWEETCATANLPFYSFETLVLYEDDVTRRLLETLSVVLDRTKEDILEDFGTYVVTDERFQGIRRLLRFGGESYLDFLRSLEDLSARLKVAMPFLPAPNLALEELPDDVYSVHHEYSLPGYGPVLLGILRAMADDYGALVTIEHHVKLKGPVQRDRFDIRLHEECWQHPSRIWRMVV